MIWANKYEFVLTTGPIFNGCSIISAGNPSFVYTHWAGRVVYLRPNQTILWNTAHVSLAIRALLSFLVWLSISRTRVCWKSVPKKNPVDFPIIKDMHNQSDHFGRWNPQFLEKSTCVKLLKSLDLLLRLVFAWWGGTYLGWAARVTSPQGRDGTLLPFFGHYSDRKLLLSSQCSELMVEKC